MVMVSLVTQLKVNCRSMIQQHPLIKLTWNYLVYKFGNAGTPSIYESAWLSRSSLCEKWPTLLKQAICFIWHLINPRLSLILNQSTFRCKEAWTICINYQYLIKSLSKHTLLCSCMYIHEKSNQSQWNIILKWSFNYLKPIWFKILV